MSDFAWIAENLHVFFPATKQCFEETGRGAIVTDTTTLVEHEGGARHPFAYMPAVEIEKQRWKDVMSMVRAHDPSWELVAVLVKRGRESAYRIGVPSERK